MKPKWTTLSAMGLTVLAVMLLAGGCRKPEQHQGSQEGQRPRRPTLTIVSSTFPIWLFTRNVTSGVPNVSVSLLLPATLGCPHDYVVTPTDVQRLGQADILVVNGLGLDDFAVEQFRNLRPNARVIVSSAPIENPGKLGRDGVPAVRRPMGTEAEAHQFASPRLAARMVLRIAEGLAEADSSNADRYRRNASVYSDRLTDLADEFREAVAHVPNKRILTQHSVFELLAQDVGIEIVGIIQAHAGHDPSAQEVMALVTKARSTRAAAVMTEPQYPPKLGRTIAKEAGIRVGVLDPVASGPEDAPLDYYETIMRQNIRTLRGILGASSAGG